MPDVVINGAKLHYTDTGGEKDVVLFAHGLGWSGRMFSAQVDALSPFYRCVTVDFRGQGKSEATRAGYDIDELTADTAELIWNLDLDQVHFVGLSMGGFVGMRLAVQHPNLIKSLCLLNTSSDAERPWKRFKYSLLSLAILCFGVRPVPSVAMRIMFGKSFLNEESRGVDRAYWRSELLSNRRLGIARAIRGVVKRSAIRTELGRVAVPTLVVVGAEDTATPPACGEAIVESIPDATLHFIPKCGHSSTIERPENVSETLKAFLKGRSEH